jgi:hypothetical protein
MTLNRLFPLANASACLLFVLLREPAPLQNLALIDNARWNGGLYNMDQTIGTVACRELNSWSEWHGGEASGVKILEVINLPAFALTGIADAVGEPSIGRRVSICRWSWVLAAVFLVAASVQWWLLGTWLDLGLRWFRNRRGSR